MIDLKNPPAETPGTKSNGQGHFAGQLGRRPVPAGNRKRQAELLIEHVVEAIDRATQSSSPFYHLRLTEVFPAEIYSAMMQAMPSRREYRQMSGRTKSTRTRDGGGTRTKIDLFPEYIRHLPRDQRPVWTLVGEALCSPSVRDAFKHRLGPGLAERFGPDYAKVGMYPVPVLTRDVPGYRIGIHPDTHWKGMTIQLYLPRDHSIEHVGTVFHRRTGGATYEKALQMAFAPNTRYAFAVAEDTYHSVETVGPEVRTRDSILLTYFVDHSVLQIMRNRLKRVGNFVMNEGRHFRT